MTYAPRSLPAEFLRRPHSVAHAVATFLARSGVLRIYGLTGSHIKPLWDEATRAGLRVIDVRHEAAAVHMAQADAELTGEPAVAVVTTGPGLANAVPGIAAAHQARVPVLILSALPPSAQLGLGALEELDQAGLVRSITRLAGTVRHPRQLLPFLQASFEAAVGAEAPPGPAFLDFPTDVLRGETTWSRAEQISGAPRALRPIAPTPEAIDAAAAAIRTSRRPVVISGRGARAAQPALSRFLATSGALYLDTPESRGLVADDHPAYVPAMRSAVMGGADTVITVGRRLDFALAYGSNAAFPAATFIRIGRHGEELTANRVGDVQVHADTGRALELLAASDIAPDAPDTGWLQDIRDRNARRRKRWADRARAEPTGPDGAIHPNALISVINETLAGADQAPIVIADGGDTLSFARVGLTPPPRLDTGTFGLLGVGVPFAIAASLLHPDRTVLALIGDGAFGFNAMELDTARRTGARPIFVISNNSAWNIERLDHVANYTANPRFNTELPGCRYDQLARSLGMHAQRVTSLDRLAPALHEAIAHAPSLIDVRTSGEIPSPDFTAGLADLPDLHVVRGWDDAERALHTRQEEG
ncbi:thiamine pyrophosphate-binding protein [Streptomyces sp. NPDC058001]|uniref:thiamine pyrophosphate-binding protein n=1 Tax=Streptomyces sp. NPDC058001 TaxID=3346300 RepID=UPI0036F03280